MYDNQVRNRLAQLESNGSLEASYVTNSGDCDDTNRFMNPLSSWHQDADNDNYGNAYTTGIVQCSQPVT